VVRGAEHGDDGDQALRPKPGRLARSTMRPWHRALENKRPLLGALT
jgi:hypothetical protein